MRARKGIFIVLEGSDGSGKATQLTALVRRLKKEGIAPKKVDFPRYREPSAYFVTEYLNGRYGSLRDMGPYQSSLFYALDRFDASFKLRRWLREGHIVLANRYVSSNMGHQGAKIGGAKARRKYFAWLHDLEYGILGIPRPDLTIVLNVPARVAQRLVDKKGAREYIGGVRRDLHEADIAHLKRAEATYREMARLFPKEFRLVECVEGGRLLSIEEVHEKIWMIVRAMLRGSRTRRH